MIYGKRKRRVTIVGAGLAGLSCALRLRSLGIDYHLYEAADDVGGRVRTDLFEGFRLDRGFQVLLEAYPETQRVLDYPSLELERLEPGAKIFFDGRFQTVADPLRRPQDILASLRANVATFRDKLRIPFWKLGLASQSLKQIFTTPDQTTLAYLQECGFSDVMIQRFFRPFLSGIFLEPNLETSSHMARFVLKMMSTGAVAVPRFGMGQISNQLADRVGRKLITLNCPVRQVEGNSVELSTGEVIESDTVILSTDRSAAFGLQGKAEAANSWNGVQCLYFSAPKAPLEGAWLALNGEGTGPVNNVVVMSNVSAEYAPKGRHLISASLVGSQPSASTSDVLAQLEGWFGGQVNRWEHLKTYNISRALPQQGAGYFSSKRHQVLNGFLVCGDYCETASIQGAMHSGRKIAEYFYNCSR
jgi:phytoene dehydrogenase-like protein